MDKLYWAIEYMKVFITFIFIMYLWPSVVFKKHLKKKNSRTYKFAFCSVVQLIIINTSVLGLGLLHILRPWVFNILFYGTFFFFLLKDVRIEKQTLLKLKYLVSGTYGAKSLFSDFFKFIRKKISNIWERFLTYMKGRWFEYSLLLVIVVFGVIYFSVNAFEENSYGYGDLYMHHSWVYYLTQGIIFNSGVYPEAMHCFIAVENMSFGISIYNALLFFGPIYTSIIIISLYLLFRELFRWKWSPMIAIALILTVDVKCLYAIASFSRWQWTMPQEYGYPAAFFCLLYLIRFFKNGKKYTTTKKPMFLKDEDLFLFTFSLASTIAAHFYATVIAFMMCVAGVVILIRWFFSKKFLGMIVACLAGLMIAMGPMLGALAEGMHFQGSVGWALSLILSEEQFNALYGIEDPEPIPIVTPTPQQEETETPEVTVPGNSATFTAAIKVTNLLKLLTETDVAENVEQTASVLSEKLDDIYTFAYTWMYGKDRADLILFMYIVVAVAWLLIRIIILIIKLIAKKSALEGHRFDGYLVLILCSFIFSASYALAVLGIPEILEQYRVCAIAQIFSMAVLVVPVDIIGFFLLDKINAKIRMGIVLAMVCSVYVGTKLLDCFHGYLMIELTRYNSSVLVTNAITNTMGRNANFTLVSTTDELYPILGYGYHEELISFINSSEVVSYTLPTEYVFILIEKNPIYRANHHFANGPSWIAENKYVKYYEEGTTVYPEVRHITISEDYANLYFGKFPSASLVYNTLWQRTVLNSKMYVWCQKFNAMYPNELHVFYEDDDIVCYYLRQNPRNLYELATMDPSVMVPADSYEKPIWPESYADKMEKD